VGKGVIKNMPQNSLNWRPDIEVPGTFIKEYWLPDGFMLMGHIAEFGKVKKIYSGTVFENGNCADPMIRLGSRNFYDLETTKRWCDLMVFTWWEAGRIKVGAIEHAWSMAMTEMVGL